MTGCDTASAEGVTMVKTRAGSVCTFAALAALLMSGCGDTDSGDTKNATSPSNETKSFDVRGAFDIVDPEGFIDDGSYCEGSGGYDDVHVGAQIVVRDADGTQVAIGELGNGRVVQDGSVCSFHISVNEVPAESDIYTIEVAGRGEISFTQKDAEDNLSLTLG